MTKTFNLDQLTTGRFEELRQITDPLADNTIQHLLDMNAEEKINDVFMTLVKNSSIDQGSFSHLGVDISKVMNSYFDTSSKLPEWADLNRIKRGEEVFALYGPEIFMLLNMSSLPLCYSCAKGAQVLYDTGRLLAHGVNVDPLARRLMETAQMVANVLSPDGLIPQGQGLITIQKVRLIHASIRYYLRKNGKWDANTFGQPINQEDLTGTLMSFGPVILSGLKQLDIALTDQQINDYLHTWKVVGYLMGIQEELLPDNYDQAFGLATKILVHEAAPSEAGKALTSSCISFVQSMIPGHEFDDVPAYMMDFFLSEFSKSSEKDLSTCIGINHNDGSTKDKIIFSLSKFVSKEMSHMEHNKVIQHIAEPFNRRLLQSIINYYNDGKKVSFSIPPSLTKNWNLESKPIQTEKMNDIIDGLNKKTTITILITSSLLVLWSYLSSVWVFGSITASIITYGLYLFYWFYAVAFKNKLILRLAIFGTVAGLMELYTDHYLVDTINSLVYPGNELMIWSSPAYMPFAWSNVILQLSFIGVLLTQKTGLLKSSIILGLAGGMYIPLYEHLAKDAGWWWYHDNVSMVFNAPVYVIVCEALISLSLPLLVYYSEHNKAFKTIGLGVLEGIWIYIAAVLAFLIAH